ncbi:serine--tRNA ligase [Buchnera aphidicola]|uniref:serine--tRNA ligase n=1 Tax=Buchnera aphidicola TaxID=9 RepID=UPI0034644979
MIDPYLLRYKIQFIEKKLYHRGFKLDTIKFNNLEKKRKILQITVENLRTQYKKLSLLIGNLKKKNKNCDYETVQVEKVKKQLTKKEEILKKIQNDMKIFISKIPNIADDTVPIGSNSCNNQNIIYWGNIKKYDFHVQDHVTLGNNINGFDWYAASKISGSRFVIMKNKIARLHRVLSQFMLDVHTINHGYSEIYLPYLVNHESMYGAGQLPKFKKEIFYVSTLHKNKNNHKYILIPTSEVPLTNLFKNQVLKENDLPIMLTAYSPCFRAENLSYGKDSRGLIRMHQFDKVEIFQITTPEKSMKSLEILTLHAEEILKLLKLPYRKVLLCTQEMGFSSSKTYDLEVWFPSQNKYREISSCSNMSDFQSRRVKTKYFQMHSNKKNFVHTINGSGLAVGRTLAAILENYQNHDGSIEIPEILRDKYMNGLKYIN